MNHCTLARERAGLPTWQPAWRLECEARYLLSLPLSQRREALAAPGRAGRVEALKAEMLRLHDRRSQP